MLILKKALFYTVFLLLLFSFSNCSITRRIPDGQSLYTGAKVNIEKINQDIKTKDLSTQLTFALYPSPNRRLFNIRWRLRLYNTFYSKKQKGLFHWISTNIGEEPVLYDAKNTQSVEKVLESIAINNGYFSPTISHDVETKKKKTSVVYTVQVDSSYHINNIQYDIEQDSLLQIINNLQTESLVKKGQRYQLQQLRNERIRIEKVLKDKGYYFFEADFLKFYADTTLDNRQINLSLRLKKGIPQKDLNIYHIGDIRVFPDYNSGLAQTNLTFDTLDIQDLKLIFQNELSIHPEVLENAIVPEKGAVYTFKAHNNTIQRLSNLNVYKFISVRFTPNPEQDSLLDLKILLTPRVKNTVEGTLGFSVRSFLFFGPEYSVSYINRNAFKGAELLKISSSGNFNTFLWGESVSFPFPKFQKISTDVSLSKPGILVPFRKKPFPKDLIGTSKLVFGFSEDKIDFRLSFFREIIESENYTDLLQTLNQDTLASSFFALDDLSFTYGYTWYKKRHLQYFFNPFSLHFQNGRYESASIQNLLVSSISSPLENDVVQRLQEAVLFQPDYAILYDSRLKGNKSHNYFNHARFVFSYGYFLEELNNKSRTNQYIQIENDFRYYYTFNPIFTVATRLLTNFTFPFQDEVIIPYNDLYTIGGTTGVRAFAPRTVGPGASHFSNNNVLLESGYGDIHLEASLEFRYKANDFVEIALFVDAGNVWLTAGETSDVNAQFHLNSFYRQLAIGGGFGFRLDFDYFIIRLDLATPFTKPWQPNGLGYWVLDDIALGKRAWRRENLSWNFAFGYPF